MEFVEILIYIMKTQYVILTIITILFIGFIIGAYIILVKPNQTPEVEDIITKTDPLTGKNVVDLIGTSDKQGLERAKISDDVVEYTQSAERGGNIGTIDVPQSPWSGHMGEQYWPPSIHPSFIFYQLAFSLTT